jgi:hypothetical protein
MPQKRIVAYFTRDEERDEATKIICGPGLGRQYAQAAAGFRASRDCCRTAGIGGDLISGVRRVDESGS